MTIRLQDQNRSEKPQTFHQRLQRLAQEFRNEWGFTEIAPEEWTKLCYYAAHPEYDLEPAQ